ncbi:MAG TPA: PDZ domain-containing protein [Gemmatimonadaceae bacterium]|nr:PDZ domain-containing protein [Gemmatimonadaceae bacterium]
MNRTTIMRISLALIVLAAMIPRAAHAQREASRGWVGVAYTTGVGTTDHNGAMVFADYPVIESIEPNSPAERAGLSAGDTILAMNSQDLRKSPLPVASMVQPGKRIVFRFRRNAVREVTLTVAPRPRGSRESYEVTIFGPALSPSQPLGSGPGSQVLLRRPRPAAEVAARAAAAPVTPIAAMPSIVLGGPRILALAGAELTELNPGLGALAGVETPGVFVINVAVGTPAKESGLRPGDVIVKAGSLAIGDPGELIRAFRESNGSSLRLEIIRNKKPQTITLRW